MDKRKYKMPRLPKKRGLGDARLKICLDGMCTRGRCHAQECHKIVKAMLGGAPEDSEERNASGDASGGSEVDNEGPA